MFNEEVKEAAINGAKVQAEIIRNCDDHNDLRCMLRGTDHFLYELTKTHGVSKIMSVYQNNRVSLIEKMR